MASTTTQGTRARVPPDQAQRLDASSSAPRPPPSLPRHRRPGPRRPDRLGDGRSAGLEHAVELAELAMEETGFGVFEDKVVKNYIATEFLYDYLKDKRSVGVIDEDAERAIEYVAEPIGVVLALLPITNPTSTVLFKAIVAAKTRNAMIFRPVGARGALRARARSRSSRRPARRPGCRRTRCRSSPTRRSTSRSTSSTTPASTSSGRPAARRRSPATNEAGKPCLGVGPGNAPVYVHRSADVRMAVVDMLISKTFDASVICPAEQTLRRRRRDLRRAASPSSSAWARGVLDARRGRARSPPSRSTTDGASRCEALGQSCVEPRRAGRLRGRRPTTRCSLAPLPTDLDELAAHPLAAREADAGARARALAVGRARASPPASWSPSTAASATPRRSTPRDEDVDRALRRARSAPAGSSSTPRPRSARWAASTTR